MKNIKSRLILMLLITLSFGCKRDIVDGIILEDTLVIHQDFWQNREMISLIKASLESDSLAFKKLVLFPNGGGEGSYNLGYVITQIIYKLGEPELLKMLKSFDGRELANLKSMIDVGLEYGDNDYDNKMDGLTFSDEFPRLKKFIDEK